MEDDRGMMMGLWKKFNYIFTKGQKIKLVLLFFMIVIGTFAELFGVTSILPIIQVATEPDAVNDNIMIQICQSLFHCTTTAEMKWYNARNVIITDRRDVGADPLCAGSPRLSGTWNRQQNDGEWRCDADL